MRTQLFPVIDTLTLWFTQISSKETGPVNAAELIKDLLAFRDTLPSLAARPSLSTTSEPFSSTNSLISAEVSR